MKIFMSVYAFVCYQLGFAALVYAIGFIGNFWVPKHLNSGTPGPFFEALMIDLGLIALFGIQHSVMARPAFKERWTNFIPEPIERASYLLATTIVLVTMYVFWQPIDGVIWDLRDSVFAWVLWAGFAVGWLVVVLSGFLIDHFHLFGLKQVWSHVTDKPIPDKGFRTPLFYKFVRHPIYSGMLLAFWSTPFMTVSHLVFAGGFTTYIVIGAILEEHDLEAYFGDTYRKYRQAVPMLLPARSRRLP